MARNRPPLELDYALGLPLYSKSHRLERPQGGLVIPAHTGLERMHTKHCSPGFRGLAKRLATDPSSACTARQPDAHLGRSRCHNVEPHLSNRKPTLLHDHEHTARVDELVRQPCVM